MVPSTVAIVSTNKCKYSETFIYTLMMNLYKDILYLFDGYLPQSYSDDKLKTEHRITDIKQLLFSKNIKIVLAEYGPSGVEMMQICEDLSIPLIVHFHGYDAYRNDILGSYGLYYKSMFQKASAVVAVSKHMASQLEKLGCPKEKIFHIPCGANTELFTEKSTVFKKRQIVSCGRFVPKKSPQNIILAFKKVHKKFPDTQLVMIGDGELLDECKYLAKQLELTAYIHFTGPISQNQIAEIYSVSEIFIQHSIITPENDSEGTPLSIMEAGASGLSVVATRHAGIPDIIEDGINGFLVEENDISSMAEKIILLLSQKDQSIEMGNKLKEKILTYYTMERYMTDLRSLIEKTVLTFK